MSDSSIDPDQIEVEAEYYFKQDNGKPSLSQVQLRLLQMMQRRGYSVLTHGDRVLEFILRQTEPRPSIWSRLKQISGLESKEARITRIALENLRETRDNQTFRVNFRFVPVEWEDGDSGFRVEIEAIPALSEKIDRLKGDYSQRNLKSVVRTNKREIKNIAVEMGFSKYIEPYTRSDTYRATIDDHLRKQLEGKKYGMYVSRFIDDADEALRYSLFRPAICAYVHGIEWAIICHIDSSRDRDIIMEEGYDQGKYFKGLIEEIEKTGEVTQTTSEALRTMNTERVWMAHHKSGDVSEAEVQRVKQRTGILLEELFI